MDYSPTLDDRVTRHYPAWMVRRDLELATDHAMMKIEDRNTAVRELKHNLTRRRKFARAFSGR